LDEADVFELRIVISFDIGNDDLRRIANEKQLVTAPSQLRSISSKR
jgi:hypothetical protein